MSQKNLLDNFCLHGFIENDILGSHICHKLHDSVMTSLTLCSSRNEYIWEISDFVFYYVVDCEIPKNTHWDIFHIFTAEL
jgi:hypothetical protein